MQLSWTTTGATACTAAAPWKPAGPRPLGHNTPASETQGPLQTTTVFPLTCSGPGGSVTAHATAEVMTLPTITLSCEADGPAVGIPASRASACSVPQGQRARLTWSAKFAQSCSVAAPWTPAGPRATGFPIPVSELQGPLQSTATYALTCTNAAGTATASVTAQVQSASKADAP